MSRRTSTSEAKFAAYLRARQADHGGWPLFQDGAFDMSATVKAYFALKMIGDDVDAPHMRRAREAVLARGGAVNANVFTRVLLSLYGVLTWKSVPVMPVEIMLLPAWFPFHLTKVSYWARTVIVPLLVLQALKPVAKNPRGIGIDELFVENPREIGPPERAPHQNARWFGYFRVVDVLLRATEPWLPSRLRKRAIDRAVAFVTERLNGEDGLGAIYPAMANSVMMFEVLGYPPDHPDRAIARASIDKLVVDGEEEGYCQPCVSPVWDTALVCHTLLEAGDGRSVASVKRGLQWLLPRQVLDVKGDWTARRPDVRPGGWAFQYANPHYPDLDDTAVVVMAMDRLRRLEPTRQVRPRHRPRPRMDRRHAIAQWRIRRLRCGQHALPSQQHPVCRPRGAARSALRGRHRAVPVDARPARRAARGQPGRRPRHRLPARDPAPRGKLVWPLGHELHLRHLVGAVRAQCRRARPAVGHDRKAADWLIAIQNPDGGWGEDGASYKLDYRGYEKAPSTASQTAWALLGLMSAGRTNDPAVQRGIAYLASTQAADGFWNEPRFTATGFPRVFYLRYHGYRKFFPLWALARYRNLQATNSGAVAFGM